MYDAYTLSQRFARIKARHNKRDSKMTQVKQIREGNLSLVAPSIFPDSGPWQEPIVANMIDIAARDMAELIAPLPTITCSSSSSSSTRASEAANKRSQIVQGYIANSNLQVQMYNGADNYVTYGMLPIRTEADYETNMPVIRVLDPIGSYVEHDRFGRVVSFWQRIIVPSDELKAQYPEYASVIEKDKGPFGSENNIEVIIYHDKKYDSLALMNTHTPVVLDMVENELGRCLVSVVSRPGVTEIPRGQFDDVIFVQLAKSRFALLALQGAHEAVNAPLVVPNDVGDVPIGPGATIRTSNPEGVRRVALDVPREAFSEQSALERELQLGARFPEARTGNMDNSQITGSGVRALMDGYDNQLRAHQALFARALEEQIANCLEMDEVVFGQVNKKVKGINKGTPYTVTYTPAKDIAGLYDVDVKYGLMAGLDPNRWLVFALQARAEKMFSRDFMQHEMPIDINVEDEKNKIDIEDMEDALKQAVMGYAQSIPALAAGGQDPMGPINALVALIDGRRKGKALADLAVEAFKPPEPTPAELAAQAAAMGQGPPGMEEDPMAAMMAAEGGQAPGLGSDGLMEGVAPGQAGMGPGGRPDLQTMLAGLDARGNPNLAAAVTRQQPI